jgi:hypothetical protein
LDVAYSTASGSLEPSYKRHKWNPAQAGNTKDQSNRIGMHLVAGKQRLLHYKRDIQTLLQGIRDGPTTRPNKKHKGIKRRRENSL